MSRRSLCLSQRWLPGHSSSCRSGTVEDLAGLVPTLTVSHRAGLAQVTIRGIGTNSVVLGADPSSTTHLDGVYLARPAMGFMDFLNVERVEVLRGPQGTLYGRNSVGGTINIVTRQPTNALEASVRLTAGDYDRLRAEGAVSGPLVKNKVMGNFAFVRGTRTGFVKDLDHPEHALGSEDTWAGRAQLRLVLGTRGELLLSGDHQRSEGIPLPEAKPIAAKPGVTFKNNPSLWDVRASHLATGENIQQGTSAKLTVQLNTTTTLSSLTAYRRSNYHGFFDADATELILQTTDVPDIQRQTSQELTLVRHTPRLTWIGGAFLFEEHIEGRVEITVYKPAVQIRPFARVGTNARALFGQATYRLSGRVSLTGGVRYTDEQKDTENTGGTYRIGTDTLSDQATFYQYVDTVAFDAWTPKIGIEAQASQDTLMYLSAARGFKSGGFNPAAPRPGLAFNPEFAWTYEGGLKRSMAGGRVRANTAVFYSDYRDLQVQSFISSGVPDIRNAAAATIKGVEVEVAAAARRGVHSGLRLSGHLAWLDATYDRFLAVVPGGSTRPVAGNHLNNAPEWSGSGSVVYDFATGSAGTASVRGDLSWQSRVFFTPVNDAIETQQRVRARPSARWLRAAQPPVGVFRLRAQCGQPGIHHRHGKRRAGCGHRSAGRASHVGYAVHSTPLTGARTLSDAQRMSRLAVRLSASPGAKLKHTETDIPRRRRVLPQAQRVEQLMDEADLRFPGIAARRPFEVTAAQVDDAAVLAGEGEHSRSAALRARVAVEEDDQPEVGLCGDTHLPQLLRQRQAASVAKLGQDRLTGWLRQPLGCGPESASRGVAGDRIANVDPRPGKVGGGVLSGVRLGTGDGRP